LKGKILGNKKEEKRGENTWIAWRGEAGMSDASLAIS